MKLIELTRDQCIKFSPLDITQMDRFISGNLKYSDSTFYVYPLIIFKGDVADAMTMKIRTQLSGKPADKEAAALIALRLQGLI